VFFFFFFNLVVEYSLRCLLDFLSNSFFINLLDREALRTLELPLNATPYFFIFVLALARYKLQYYHRSPPLHRVEKQCALHDIIILSIMQYRNGLLGGGREGVVWEHLMWCNNWLMEIIKYK